MTQQLLAAGDIQFTIDQQPYLQGFLPILQMYMYKVSQSLTGIADVNTGLKFLDKTTVGPYNSTKSRYEGTSSSAGVAQGRHTACGCLKTPDSGSTPPSVPPPQGPASSWARRGGALSLGQRFLTLREGSIIVVTLIAIIYFAATTSRFTTRLPALQALLPFLRPVRDSRGRRGVCDGQRRDRSLGRRRLPDHSVHLLTS